MRVPKVKFFGDDICSQAEYVCFLAKAIECGLFQKIGFLVLPYLLPQNRISVYFPKFSYSASFWRAIAKSQHENLGETFPNICINELVSHLKKSSFTPSSKVNQKIIFQWQQKEEKFFHLGQESLNFREILPKLTEINLLLTDFGTAGSFYPHKGKRGIKIMATFRRDFPVSEIGRTLLLCFYRIKRKAVGPLGWHERRAVVDYLSTETALSQVFPDYQLGQKWLDNKNANKFMVESENFLTELGFPQQSVINLDTTGRLVIGKKALTTLFTTQEKKTVVTLVKNRGQLVSYDQLAEAIWGNEWTEKFSLYALAKLIENIRWRLRDIGVNKNLILTVRKQGYILND